MIVLRAASIATTVFVWIASVGASHSIPRDSISSFSLAPLTASVAINATTIPNTYIVQLQPLTQGILNPLKPDLRPHEEFHKRAAGLSYTTRRTYDDQSLFVGLSLTLDNDDDLQTLKQISTVLGTWPVIQIPRPLATVHAPEARGLWKKDLYPGTNITEPHITGDTDVNSPHKMAGVDKVQASGIKGKGMKIAIIDTGVDYRHPSLGGCFGPNCKISFGYDFVGDDYPTTTVEGPDPLATCLGGGHGTHVAGIIGMDDGPHVGFGVIGVAPQANIGMYRVFGCSGSADSDIIISALLQAAADGADLVTMSLGQIAKSEAKDPFEAVTTALVEQGVAVFAAAGNDGSLGQGNPSAPGSGPDVFSVGSIENTKFPVTYQFTDSNKKDLRYSAVLPLDGPPDGLTVQVLNFGADDAPLYGGLLSYYAEAAANATAMGLNVSEVILAVKYGEYASYSIGDVAGTYGYKYVLMYTTPDLPPGAQGYQDVNPEVDYGLYPIQLDVKDSTALLEAYGKQPYVYKVYLSSTKYFAKSEATITGGTMSNFSSFGPLNDLTIKPQLSGPGGQILSTWPLELFGGYAVISGTSMSTPFMAACYALLKSQNPNLTVNETYALLQNSGTQMPWYFDESMLSTTIHQGAGAVNVHNAITWESLVTPPQLNLGTSGFTVTANFTIKNRSKKPKTYTFSHKPAAAMQASFDTATNTQQYPYYASATFGSESVLIQGGESAVVNAYITPPSDIEIYYNPIYTGYIVVSNNDETYSLPYAGRVGSRDTGLISTTAAIPVFQCNDCMVRAITPSVHGFARYYGVMYWESPPDKTNQTFSMGAYGYPGILWATTGKVDYVRFDLVPANTSFVPNLYGFDPMVTSIPTEDLVYPPANTTFSTIVGLEDVVAVLEEYPAGDYSMTSYGFWYSNPSNQPPNADYRIVMRALAPGRDYNDTSAWQSWMSAIVSINNNADFVALYPGDMPGDN
ncbi:hypothetical protein BP5796_12258 [Coleophoma crateriformis]|uniref:Peptidase S8/S53 domain-containing protein n=1 Tax=Coleophoma crateriformis TaxID=565419 RepID=A0A3D8Q9N6_9HELO|nr:hypothetical protein BP5796_12258 [Coleophoma crateriformis]